MEKVVIDSLTGKTWTEPFSEEEIANYNANLPSVVRNQRDFLLSTEVDAIAGNALRWNALTTEQQQVWSDYRQALLDIPQQAGFPHEVVWPAKPE